MRHHHRTAAVRFLARLRGLRQRFYCNSHAGTCSLCEGWKETSGMPEWPATRPAMTEEDPQ